MVPVLSAGGAVHVVYASPCSELGEVCNASCQGACVPLLRLMLACCGCWLV
jgi:hypothetical protein